MNKKIWAVGLLAAVMLIGAGCGQKPGAAPDDTPEQVTPAPDDQTGQSNGGTSNGSGGTSTGNGGNEATAPEAKTESIKAYYTDPDLMELVEGSAEISYKEDQEKYEAAYQALQKSDKADMVPLWEKIELNSLKFENGALTLDVTVPDEANLGAGGESFAVDAIKKTFFQFDEVKSLQILVDGQQTESLMGHVDLENPMTR
ncbi:GerMN domain-containing protein [Paenibacillus sp. FSL H8-0457]|uniref:GerMN domain-containing protein n=1 Tax=Bacillales TaxID=1385 RepID=UPI0001787E99|nr:MULTISPECIES: GerMN domain-containing protein [Paenibacillus]ACX64559.1 Lipoprotein LpqB, GerMN domain protein [Paenibacillus sp. Y412MC10]ETT58294.1 lipoprotein LpqB [Paenibacillus sp. FSL H8-457]MCM3256882.1 GerMN domain-containing protein [Paenibacillus lautus]